ncbi:hypothetical protein NUU61_006689 [Penicillium alfredii]|uniref:Protein kinase domain-containing protein n=1 Tax=Penicillium alfredii TaxID=1506179 RepID=A0A9W9F1F0_9EURO|nr:uncharacterized protein NUU61_006689 [Penicillium alfredii]KAJ5091819.1 hypothetical protein NUU61_006689 [Penicillium alfredii]
MSSIPTSEENLPFFDPPSTELPNPPVPYTTGWIFTAHIPSQIFTVRVLHATSASKVPRDDTRLVAKIYDPLYFDDDGGFLNPFLCVNEHYTHEANVYHHLSQFQGQGIPRFYGSYSVNLAVDSKQTRTVRMILIKYIHGVTMRDAKPEHYSQSARQKILKSIVDLDSRVYEKNIQLQDLHPRNVIISSPDRDPSGVVFIDFGKTLFSRRPDDPFALKLDWFYGQFGDWIDWDWDAWLETEFAHTPGNITPDMRKRWP